MLTIEVKLLPQNMQEERLKALYEAICNAAMRVPDLGVKNRLEMTVLFPLDMMEYGIGEEIVVLVERIREEDTDRTPRARQQLAWELGLVIKEQLPAVKLINVVVDRHASSTGYWCSINVKDSFHAWRNVATPMSLITQAVSHPLARHLVALGNPTVEIIFEKPGFLDLHSMALLVEITGEDPVLPEHREDMMKMYRDWVDWARRNGYR